MNRSAKGDDGAMTTPYQDKTGASSAYRAMLMFRTVGVLMLAVAVTAAVFPQISALAFSVVCLVLIIPALVYQIRLDSTLIHTGRALADDGACLYVVAGTFRLGFGRRHHMNKQVSSYRISCIQRVKGIRMYPFGIAVRAEVWTASSKRFDIDEDLFDTPGAMRETLTRAGRKKTVLFRLERSLRPQDESRLLERLRGLEGAEA